jgi:hypothetical protein
MRDQASGRRGWSAGGGCCSASGSGRARSGPRPPRCRRAVERLTYDRTAKALTYRSDKSEGSTAGTETADPLAFLVRVLVHIPDKGHVTTRYYG